MSAQTPGKLAKRTAPFIAPASSPPSSELESGEFLTQGARAAFEDAVLSGLLASPKTLPCKYFYDARGSRLFEQICETPEYYVTRTELALLKAVCSKVAKLVGPHVDVLEPGCGAGEKIRILLDALKQPRSFTPIDISRSSVEASARTLTRDYPNVAIHPLVADFTASFEAPSHFFAPQRSPYDAPSGRRLIFFPGSTISNFTPQDALPFLQRLRQVLRPGDFLFIGVDRIKDKEILERAYNDAQGVTAAFNLNLLRRIARELGVDLDPNTFSHRAFYDARACRIEMHLDSKCDQTIWVCGRPVSFRKGESIHTENSYKYSPEGFRSLATQAGYQVRETYSDQQELFSLYLCQVFG
jgi:dimethylhistidine N-methyltransferase